MTTRSATAILAEIRDGKLLVELSEAIKTAVAAVGDIGKPATLRLELTIAPLRKGAEHLVEAPLLVSGEIVSKLPKHDPEATLFFNGRDGNLTQSPPDRQPGLPLSVAAFGGDKSK